MINYNEHFKAVTKQLAIEIIHATSQLPYSDSLSIIRRQLIRCVTSTAANYRAVSRSRSENERFSKMCLVVEEADETVFWLEILNELNVLSPAKITELLGKEEEIRKVMAVYRKSLKTSK